MNSPAAQRAFGRSIEDFGPLNSAEQKLHRACRTGETAVVGGSRPSMCGDENNVRAAFVRFLALGGDYASPVHDHGVRLEGAWIVGDLDLSGAEVARPVSCVSCHIAGRVLITDSRFRCGLDLSGSRLGGIDGDHVKVDGSVNLAPAKSDRFEATGLVRLRAAAIGGSLICWGGRFESGQADPDGDGSRLCLQLDGAQISGDLNLGAVGDHAFEATGEVRLYGANIQGSLDCSGGKFTVTEPATTALGADGSQIAGDVNLRRLRPSPFEAHGEVSLIGVRIGGDLDCSDGRFQCGENGRALTISRAEIKGWVFVTGSDQSDVDRCFNAYGVVRLNGALISGDLDCNRARFRAASIVDSGWDKSEFLLRPCILAQGLRVAGTLRFNPASKEVAGVDLGSAEIGVLDDGQYAWGEQLILDGLVYRRLCGTTLAAERIKWLKQQIPQHRAAAGAGRGQGSRPQPWLQLRRVLREMGHLEDARLVGIEFENELRRANRIGPPPRTKNLIITISRSVARMLHALYGVLTGYGYRPMRLFAWMAGTWVVCAVLYWIAAYAGIFGPTTPALFTSQRSESATRPFNWYTHDKVPREYPTFSPVAYSLDVLLPVVDLQQERTWGPITTTPKESLLDDMRSWSWCHAVRLLVWFETLAGWIGSLMFIAFVSGLARRRGE